jgi:glycerol-3-phosphate acyltransferase PlsY
MVIINYILLCVLFYLLGSIPVSYLIVKKKTGKNIINEGSGNAGALNSFDVTKSKSVGILVLILDFLKGALPALFISLVIHLPVSLAVLPLSCVVLGHNFSVWIKFKGGRGLATSAGICVVVNFWLLIIWCVVFLIFFALKRNVHVGNIAATFFLPLVVIFTSDFLIKFNYDFNYSGIEKFQDNFGSLFTITASVCILILIRHIEPAIDLLKKFKKNESESAVKNN